jgi:hypothetical protein
MPTLYRQFESDHLHLTDEFNEAVKKIVDVIGTEPITVEGVLGRGPEWCILDAHLTVLGNIYAGVDTHLTYWDDAMACAMEYILYTPEGKRNEEAMKSLIKSITDIHYKMRILHADYWEAKKIAYANHDAFWARLK